MDFDLQMNSSQFNSTGTGENPSGNMVVGFITLIAASFIFGSYVLPVKKFETGNGLFFQWTQAVGIFFIGILTNIFQNPKVFYNLPVFGGALWCTGNVLCVSVISVIGLAKALLIWCSFSLIVGWASSRYGWFNTTVQKPQNLMMNYIGVILCVISAFVYLFLKTSGNKIVGEEEEQEEEDKEGNGEGKGEGDGEGEKDINKKEEGRERTEKKKQNNDDSISSQSEEITTKSSILQKISFFKVPIACVGAMTIGFFFGIHFVPVLHIQTNVPGASQNGLDYCFSHYTGVMFMSTIYLLAYCVYTRNFPKINPHIILPGFISGSLWAIATDFWYIANNSLSESISFPIVSTSFGPGNRTGVGRSHSYWTVTITTEEGKSGLTRIRLHWNIQVNYLRSLS